MTDNCDDQVVYRCEDDEGSFLGLFATREAARESWRITLSARPGEVVFIDRHQLWPSWRVVLRDSTDDAEQGRIDAVLVQHRPDHL